MLDEKHKASAVSISMLIVLVAVSGCTQIPDNTVTGDTSLSDIISRGKLVVGSDIPYGVMEFYDESGDTIGIDVDIAREIASGLGVELEFVDYDWESLFVAIKNGEIDFAISAITITTERMKEMLFSDPYFNGGQAIIVKANNEDIRLPDDLSDKGVGVQIDTTGHYEVQKYTSDDLISTYETYDNPDPETGMLYDLKNGNTDAVVLDYIAAISIVKEDSTLKIVGEPFTDEFYGIATKLGKSALIEEINKILRNMNRQETLKEIENRWIR